MTESNTTAALAVSAPPSSERHDGRDSRLAIIEAAWSEGDRSALVDIPSPWWAHSGTVETGLSDREFIVTWVYDDPEGRERLATVSQFESVDRDTGEWASEPPAIHVLSNGTHSIEGTTESPEEARRVAADLDRAASCLEVASGSRLVAGGPRGALTPVGHIVMLRRMAGMSRKALAREAGYSKRTLRLIESGAVPLLRVDAHLLTAAIARRLAEGAASEELGA
ncbi:MULTISPECIES: helix-turn-helix domain-containing protein [unclassified Rathayibacter]|uniref:helix-turn-helix domain-containing protein n=1 Tax=unclassified Rathayibacter TaxID=2609250 RepID=UPI00188CE936|nr:MULTISPECIES: helix-turn-helix transcriptional regulator [unclassified Rathayibacter]MBF4463446.1 helix-turn-helix transcriptional regulator [Rathayibacter sp. VKM Ac-2879]MBF4504831.1 helix-turn-helix transcriptional regulator [Rathayibacter sp. VKM Ac-2878]